MGNVVPFAGRDTLRSLVAGLGDPSRDKLASAYYGEQFLDDNQLLNIYRSNWIGRKIVDIPAMDAIRKGRDWQAKADQIELIEAEENRLGYWPKMLEAKIKARLWGGAALYIGTGDTELMEPLDPARVAKQGVKYLTVLSRRDVVAGDIDEDALSEFYGRPAYYEVTGKTSFIRVHPSRLAIFVGSAHADRTMVMGANQGWGDSAIETVYTAMRNADATAANIASLVFEANVDVFGVPDLMMHLASGPEYASLLTERLTLAATMKGINKALLMDAAETYDRKAITFATLPEVLQSFIQMVAGAADIPVTRLLGQSPSGMSSTGESDMLNYYDRISSIQNLEMTPAIYRLDECLIRSALGARPEEIFYSWSPLKQMTEKELAEIGKMNAETAQTLTNSGLFTPAELRTVVANQLIESGFYPGLDQAIEGTGQDWEQNLEEEAANAAKAAEAVAGQPTGQIAQDAAPRTLYVSRDVLNGADIVAWAKGQGFTSTLTAEDMHVTITFSRAPVDWMKMGSTWEDEVKVPRGGARLIEQFDGGAVVLLFASNMLKYRHDEMLSEGASWDHPDYQPHITISYDGAPADLGKVEPYQGEIILGPERFKEVNEDWKAGVKET